MVDRRLDPPSEGLEQGGGKERGAGDRDGLALGHAAEHALEQEDSPGVDGHEHAAEHGPRQAAADQPVDLVQTGSA